MEPASNLSLILTYQDEIAMQQAVLSLSLTEEWKAFVRLATVRHNQHIGQLVSKSASLDEMRFLQGRIKELTAIILSPDLARKRIERLTKAVEGLRAKKNPATIDSEGITNPDPDIESLLAERT